MRYEGTRKSGADQDVDVYTFTAGKSEMEILLKLTEQAYLATPKVFEITPYRNRLRNMKKVLHEVWRKANQWEE